MKIHKALVVYNKPLYQLHVVEKKDPYFFKLLQKKHVSTKNWKTVYDKHQETMEGVLRTLSLLGITTDTLFRGDLKKVGSYDLVVTIGGDGTFLDVSHYLTDQLLLGVNAAPLESTGALCRARLDNFLSLMIDLITGKLKPRIVPRLQVKVGKKEIPYPALNEVLFAHQSPAGTSRYLISFGKKTEEHKSSGIWVSTSIGSTAAIRSAGGIPMAPTHQGMQYIVREIFPEPARSITLRNKILSANHRLIFYSKMRQGGVFIDGNHIMIPINYGDKVEISAKGKKLKAIL